MEKWSGVDDDGGGNLNSRLVHYSVAQPADYKVGAAALTGEGKYELTIKEVPLDQGRSLRPEVGADGVKLNGTFTRARTGLRLSLQVGARQALRHRHDRCGSKGARLFLESAQQ